ncbi:hypothetical protein M9H77_23015 [Catharanthus roseus]|uniref:Uncharacterized protein n=1 Tax=Catharanthus roseus TaxID=4058 RepID=A0ACC0AUM1_CATRO|nr:hypothetical protein M9H77_23015 [Catharanthus roseus]
MEHMLRKKHLMSILLLSRIRRTLKEKRSLKLKKKKRVEKEKRIVERLCILDSNSILSRETESDERSKERRASLRKVRNSLQHTCNPVISIRRKRHTMELEGHGDDNHHTFGFLENSLMILISLIGDLCVKFQGEEWFPKLSIALTNFWENSWAIFLKFGFDELLQYHPPFKEFLKKMGFKEEGRKSSSFDNFVSVYPYLNFQVPTLVKYKVYPSFSNTSEFLWKECRGFYDFENLETTSSLFEYEEFIVNAYGGSNHGHGNFILEDMMVMETSLLKNIKELLEKDECSKEKVNELEKSEITKENVCFIEKQESMEKEQKEKEVVALDKSELVSIFTNQTNSILVSDSSRFLLSILALGHQHLEETTPWSLKNKERSLEKSYHYAIKIH